MADLLHKPSLRVVKSVDRVLWLARTGTPAEDVEVISRANADAWNAIEQKYRKLDGAGTGIEEMDAAEKAAVDVTLDRAAAVQELIEAKQEELALEGLRVDLVNAGKSTTKVDNRLAVLGTKITTAIERLP